MLGITKFKVVGYSAQPSPRRLEGCLEQPQEQRQQQVVCMGMLNVHDVPPKTRVIPSSLVR